MQADSDAAPSTATVASVIGHDVKRRPDQTAVSATIDRLIEDRCERRLESERGEHWFAAAGNDAVFDALLETISAFQPTGS